ncbi:glycosyltransferase family 1 protein [Bradyrhizobium sp. 176]|uniref:rhamnosyltransferase WsaF family glycosyltransferase n=1 Tax=unclassified Bradyrhizobium TaxID=2631580 RepID=UPI001FF8C2A5
MANWVRPKRVDWPVLPEDVLAADLNRPSHVSKSRISSGNSISINWVTTPAGPGSGGHTTFSRIIKYLDKAGYDNRIFFYHIHRADHKYFEDVAREHYGLMCPIGDLRDGMRDAHAVVATSWSTAYPVFNAACAGKRFYFVQDFEPYFEPVGSYSVIAENTYRMGFHGITAGAWLAQKLSREYGMQTDYFPFGCDMSHYRHDPACRRLAVAFYVRTGTSRRGTELGLLALELFARRQPQIQIHLFGERLEDLPFKCINHGPVSPAKLNEIYNQSFAGLCLSFTNLSLVPYEMLAAGCIPIVNDAEHNHIVLGNSPHVRYSVPTPHALATALEDIVRTSDFGALSQNAAESVKSATWDHAGAAVDAAFRRALHS